MSQAYHEPSADCATTCFDKGQTCCLSPARIGDMLGLREDPRPRARNAGNPLVYFFGPKLCVEVLLRSAHLLKTTRMCISDKSVRPTFGATSATPSGQQVRVFNRCTNPNWHCFVFTINGVGSTLHGAEGVHPDYHIHVPCYVILHYSRSDRLSAVSGSAISRIVLDYSPTAKKAAHGYFKGAATRGRKFDQATIANTPDTKRKRELFT